MNMIEKMARAICEAQALDPDMSCSDGYDTCWPLWAEFQAQAKAALECLKELTEGMVNAGTNAYHDELWVDKIFQEMIDAALEGK